MGIGVILTVGAIALTAAASVFAIIQGQNAPTDSPNPNIEDFKPPIVKEGTVLRVSFGKVREPGYLIAFLNLVTQAIRQKAGGKATPGGGGSQTTGHKFFADAWFALNFGQISSIEKIFVADNEEAIESSGVIFNDGTQTTFPNIAPEASPLQGTAHIFYDRWFLGENVSTAPILHFVYSRILPTTINFANMANGNNPAAIIFDILQTQGVPITQINTTSFNAAAAFWNSKGYGLNFSVNSETTAGEIIKKVLGWVDGVLHVDATGRFILNALDENDTFVAEISQEDMNGFMLNRKGWQQVPNDFDAVFIDETEKFTQRSIRVHNPAAIRLAGRRITQSIDLKCFRDKATAFKRLYEIMKKESYPKASIRIKTNYKYAHLRPGQIIRVSHADYKIVQADFRITKVDLSKIDKNDVSIEATQQVETLFDDIFLNDGGTLQGDIAPDLTPVPLTHIRAFELPYNTLTKFDPAFLILAAREKSVETGFNVLVSNNDTSDFDLFEELTTYSMRGTLDAIYPDNTRTIDDTVGILFTAFRLDPVFDTVARNQLFASTRIVIINDEVMVFEKYLPQSGNQIKLLGVVRGINHTPVQNHAINDEIWITFLAENVLQNVPYDPFYFKVLPRFLNDIVDASLVTAKGPISITGKALEPRKPTLLIATRSLGTTIDLQIYPTTPGVNGAGDESENVTDSPPPFSFAGDFEIDDGINPAFFLSSDQYPFTTALATTITVKSRLNDRLSAAATVFVDTANGEYRGS